MRTETRCRLHLITPRSSRTSSFHINASERLGESYGAVACLRDRHDDLAEAVGIIEAGHRAVHVVEREHAIDDGPPRRAFDVSEETIEILRAAHGRADDSLPAPEQTECVDLAVRAGCRTVADERSAAVENRQRLSPSGPARSVDHDIDAPAGGCEDERRPARIAVVEAGLGTEGRRVVELHSIRGGDRIRGQLAADLKGVDGDAAPDPGRKNHMARLDIGARHRSTKGSEASQVQSRRLLEREALGLRVHVPCRYNDLLGQRAVARPAEDVNVAGRELRSAFPVQARIDDYGQPGRKAWHTGPDPIDDARPVGSRGEGRGEMTLIVEEPGVAPVERRGSQGYDDLAWSWTRVGYAIDSEPGSRPEETRRTALIDRCSLCRREYTAAFYGGAWRAPGATVDRASPPQTQETPGAPAEGRGWGRTLVHWLPVILIPAAVIGGWELYCRASGIDPTVLPAPSRIAEKTWEARDVAATHAWQTIKETLIGFSASIVVAVSSRLSWIRLRSPPRPLPAPRRLADHPDHRNRAADDHLVRLRVASQGTRGHPGHLLSNRRRAARWVRQHRAGGHEPPEDHGRHEVADTLPHVRAPTAMPYFFTGVRIAATYAVVAAIFAEYVGAYNGLGIWMLTSKNPCVPYRSRFRRNPHYRRSERWALSLLVHG